MTHAAFIRRRRWAGAVVAGVAAWLALSLPARANLEVTFIRNNGPSSNRVDLLILGDGYTAADIASGKYANDVENFVNGVFAQEPYSEYRNYYNVIRVDVESAESGADHPERTPQVFKNTAFDSTYNCSGIQRLICANNSKVNAAITNAGIAADQRDAVLVLVNDTEYGGSGGSIAVASINAAVVELVLHEVGHSFGLLADEYGGPPPPSCVLSEPSNANATRQTNPALVKWNAWVDPGVPLPTPGATNGVPGYYEGAVYCDTGAYRPTFNSKMRSLNQGFHQINTEQHIKRIYNFVSPIDGSFPGGSIVNTGPSQFFSVDTPAPFTHSLDVVWRLDGVVQGGGNTYTANGMGAGQHTVTATINDATPMVRVDPGNLLNEVRSWTVNVTLPGPIITLQPGNRVLGAGASTSFGAAAIGTGTLTWAWQLSTDGGVNWSPVPNAPPYTGVATPTLLVAAAPVGLNGNRYRAVVTDVNGSVSTNAVLLTVYGPGVSFITNPDFTTDGNGWSFFEVPDIVWGVAAGFMQFYKASPTTTPSGQAVVFQQTGVAIPANTGISASFDLGNTSSIRKRITVLVLDASFNDLHVCTFYLKPGDPVRTYQMKTHTNQAWSNTSIYFYAATAGFSGGNYLLDNVSVRMDPAASLTRTDCIDPTAPAPPSGEASANLLTNGDFATGATTPWSVFGNMTSQVSGGVFEFYRPNSNPPAGVLVQSVGPMLPNQILTASVQLGNSSGTRRRITVLLNDADFSDLVACTFWLPAGQPLGTYTMRTFTTRAWGNANISFYSATVGALPWARIDNVTLQKTPADVALGTECIEPPPPPVAAASGTARPGGVSRSSAGADLVSRDFVQSAAQKPQAVDSSTTFELDLRDARGATLVFRSTLPESTVPGEVRLSLDGVTWATAAVVPPADDDRLMRLDLSDFAGRVVYLQFTRPPGPRGVWRIGQIALTVLK